MKHLQPKHFIDCERHDSVHFVYSNERTTTRYIFFHSFSDSVRNNHPWPLNKILQSWKSSYTIPGMPKNHPIIWVVRLCISSIVAICCLIRARTSGQVLSMTTVWDTISLLLPMSDPNLFPTLFCDLY